MKNIDQRILRPEGIDYRVQEDRLQDIFGKNEIGAHQWYLAHELKPEYGSIPETPERTAVYKNWTIGNLALKIEGNRNSGYSEEMTLEDIVVDLKDGLEHAPQFYNIGEINPRGFYDIALDALNYYYYRTIGKIEQMKTDPKHFENECQMFDRVERLLNDEHSSVQTHELLNLIQESQNTEGHYLTTGSTRATNMRLLEGIIICQLPTLWLNKNDIDKHPQIIKQMKDLAVKAQEWAGVNRDVATRRVNKSIFDNK